MTLTASASPQVKNHRRWPYIIALVALVLIPIGLQVIDNHWPFRYRNVEPLLQKVFASQVKIYHYHRTYFPNPGFVADDLTIRRNSAPDLPPVGSAQHLRVEGRWIDLLLLRKRVMLVHVDGLHIVIPPVGSRANHEDFPPGSSADFAGPTTVVEQLHMTNALLDIMRNDGSRYSFPIRDLLIGNLQAGQKISYVLDMQTTQPSGHIQARGTFGPLLAKQLASTPLSGDFTYAPVNLADIGGIRGTLSATGNFHGTLADIEATANSNTPDFAVGKGRPTPVSTTASGAVNGLNADIVLHSVDAHTGHTTVHAAGTIAGSPKITKLDISANGRAQDILRPFLHGDVPVTGAVTLHSRAFVAAAANKEKFLDRLKMEGAFDIPSEHITQASTERSLTAFSQRAQGLPSPRPDDDSVADVLSAIGGPATLRHAIVSTSRFTFRVPGAEIDNLSGTFNLLDQNVHLLGDLRMQSDISHVTTGFKSLLLKPLAPFFKKQGSGAVIPIAITGSPGQYKVSQNLLHKK